MLIPEAEFCGGILTHAGGGLVDEVCGLSQGGLMGFRRRRCPSAGQGVVDVVGGWLYQKGLLCCGEPSVGHEVL